MGIQNQNILEDIQYWTAAISVDKSILKDNNEIVVHYHITYGNGYLSMFHFTIPKTNQISTLFNKRNAKRAVNFLKIIVLFLMNFSKFIISRDILM